MANCSDAVSQQAAEVNLQNIKSLLDRFTALMAQGAEDNQKHSRSLSDVELRRKENAATVDHLANLGFLQMAQTGGTENQQTVSPADVAAGETSKAAVGTANAQVAANIAESVSALSDVVTKFADAMTALTTQVLSQTQPRSSASA